MNIATAKDLKILEEETARERASLGAAGTARELASAGSCLRRAASTEIKVLEEAVATLRGKIDELDQACSKLETKSSATNEDSIHVRWNSVYGDNALHAQWACDEKTYVQGCLCTHPNVLHVGAGR